MRRQPLVSHMRTRPSTQTETRCGLIMPAVAGCAAAAAAAAAADDDERSGGSSAAAGAIAGAAAGAAAGGGAACAVASSASAAPPSRAVPVPTLPPGSAHSGSSARMGASCAGVVRITASSATCHSET